MPLSASTQIDRKKYERLLAWAAELEDFAYLGSTGSGHNRGSFRGFTGCAVETVCIEPNTDLLETDSLASKMESLARQFSVPDSDARNILTGGWIGLLSYEFGYAREKRLAGENQMASTPLLYAGLYLWAASHNVESDTYHLWLHPECPSKTRTLINSWLDNETPNRLESWKIPAGFTATQIASDFKTSASKVLSYITAGDCYQANLSQEFTARYSGNPWFAFQKLAEANPTPYSAFLKTPTRSVLSISPERFLEITDRTVKTSPIKGTRPRGTTPEQDAALAQELLASEKDRAENLMIVDLLRNDLSVNAQPGSVKVDELFALESYENVHHLVSHIRAELKDGVSPLQALFDAFPGGSITGAPKIRAMEIIRELEPHWRGPYCGSVFYYGLDGKLDSNIAIRTLLCENEHTDENGLEHGTIRCWGGGGIVADSEPEAEYQETLTKVQPLMKFLEDLKL
nr:aminodeoxychorismate synthase component I [Marinobacter sp. S0848L]